MESVYEWVMNRRCIRGKEEGDLFDKTYKIVIYYNMFHPIPLSPRERFDFLQKAEEALSYRTDLKIDWWCWQTPRELSDVQARIFSQLYGIRGNSRDVSHPSTADYLFRWLLAHVGSSKDDFNIEKNRHQWRRIISYYFRDNWHYCEISIAEKLLLTALRSKQETIKTDVMLWDRQLDSAWPADWILHRHLPNGRLQMGIQVAAGGTFRRKINNVLKRPRNDIPLFDKKPSDNVLYFLRHGSAVLNFPRLDTTKEMRWEWLEALMSGKRLYQSRLIKKHSPHFEKYGRWILEVLQCFHDGVMSRSIQLLSKYVDDYGYVITHPDWHSLSVRLEKIGKEQVAIIELFPWEIRKNSKKPIQFAVPIGGDFLDIYRDKAGAPAKS